MAISIYDHNGNPRLCAYCADGLLDEWARKIIKKQIENELTKNKQSAWGILLIIAIAIAREGSEGGFSLAIMALNTQTAPFFIEVFIDYWSRHSHYILLTSKVISWRYFLP